MKERWFLEIPVYRCEPEKFIKECQEKIQRHHEWLYRTSGVPQEQAARVYRLAEERIRDKHGHWRFNQVVGWIRLLAMPHQIQGEYYFIEPKRIRKDFINKRVVWQGKAFEVHFLPEQSNDDIYRELCEALNRLQREKPFRGRFLDMEVLQGIGNHMKWRALIGLDQ
jgi:hypothetical protein